MMPREWIEKIFMRLHGVYGSHFTQKFSAIQGNVDKGLENAKDTWAHELRGFADKPYAIKFALDNLPVDNPPNAMQFKELCRRAPAPELPMLPRKFDPETIERNKQRIAELTNTIVGKK